MRLIYCVVLSSLAHCMVWLGVHAWLRTPELSVHFQVPIDIDYGTASPAPVVKASEPRPSNVPEEIHDASEETAEIRDNAEGPRPKIRSRSVMSQPTSIAPQQTLSEMTAAKGSFLGLELNMKNIRNSPIVDDVKRFLQAVPDWNIFLGESGIDALTELDQLMLASADLRRENVLISGQHPGGLEAVRRAAVRQSQAFGRVPEWGDALGFATVVWPTRDDIERKLIILDAERFVIARSQDIMRVIGVVTGLKKTSSPSLFGSDERAYLALHIEGARRYVRMGNVQIVPIRLRVIGAPHDEGRNHPSTTWIITGEFESAGQAEAAKQYWAVMRDRFSSSGLVMLLGLASPLHDAEFSVEGKVLKITAELKDAELGVILGWARDFLQNR